MDHSKISLQNAKSLPIFKPRGEQATPLCLRPGDETLWDDLPPLATDPQLLARNRIIAANPSNLAHSAIDKMRTRVLRYLRQNNWTSVAITSPTPGCGKTFVSLNLAFSLAKQPDCRTLLVDLDLKRPQIGKTLGLTACSGMEDFLKGKIGLNDAFLRCGENLAIAPNREPVQFSAELLQMPETANALREMRQRMRPDVVLYDMPPMIPTDDVIAFLPNVDCVILVAAAGLSTLREVDACEQELAAHTNVLGVVLNKSRDETEKYGY